MNESAHEGAEHLLDRLEQLDVLGVLEDPTRLLAVMSERQSILTALQNTDTRELPTERREAIEQRIAKLAEANVELVARVAERMEEIRKSIQELAPRKAAVRGYGEQRSQPPPSSVRRVG